MTDLIKTQVNTLLGITEAVIALMKSDKENFYLQELGTISDGCQTMTKKLMKKFDQKFEKDQLHMTTHSD